MSDQDNHLKTVKRFGKYWVLILCLVSCTRPVGKQDSIDRGVFEGGKYSNQYFGLEVTVPPQWHVFTHQDNQDIKDSGAKYAASRVDANEHSLQRLKSKVNMLLTISKEGPKISRIDNSSLSCFAEDVEDHRPRIVDGHAYLSTLIDLLIKTNYPIIPVSEIGKTTISGREFFFLTWQGNIGRAVISQRYYARYERRYILAFVVTSTHIDNDKDILTPFGVLQGENDSKTFHCTWRRSYAIIDP